MIVITSPKKQQLFLGMLITIILVMMVQNYLLVRQNHEKTTYIERLKGQIYGTRVFGQGDTISSFTGERYDGHRMVVDPRNVGTKQLLFVYTTTCGACQGNMPNWEKLFSEIAMKKLSILGLCADSVSEMNRFCIANAVTFPTISIWEDSTFRRGFQLFPQTILLDSIGTVLKVWPGTLSRDKINDIVSRI